MSAGERLRRAGRTWLARWLGADPRGLALFRVTLGLVCLADVLRRLPWASFLYSSEGCLPPADPAVDLTWSLLAGPPPLPLTLAFFAVATAAAVAFVLGWRTKVAHVVLLACILSLHSTRFHVGNGGDRAMQLFLLWGLFLPLGRAGSLDARRLRTPAEARRQPVASLAALAVLLQLAVIYWFNAVNKWGPNWTHGMGLHYALHLDAHVTWLGVLVREHVPYAVLEAGTYGALVVEASAPFLVLSPFGTPWTRRVAIALLCGLHLGIASLLNVGLFSWAMMAAYPLLLTTGDLNALERLAARLRRRDPPPPVPEPPRLAVPAGPAPRAAWAAAQLAVAFLLAVSAVQVARENDWARQRLKRAGVEVTRPALFKAVVYTLNIGQHWGMFAPSVPGAEGRLVVDGVTADGRHVDPLTGAPPDLGPARRDMGDGFSQLDRKYADRVWRDGSGLEATALRECLIRRSQDGPPEDRLVAGAVLWVVDRSPDPGQPPVSEVVRVDRLDRRRPGAPPAGEGAPEADPSP